MGADAQTPANALKIIRAVQFGDTAHASVKMVNKMKVAIMTIRRP